MKKNIVKSAFVVLAVLLTSALLSAGILTIVYYRNIATTGNALGIEWYSEDEKEFTITTAEELYDFARLSDYYDFKKQTVKLGADIVINEGNAEDWRNVAPERRWKPIKDFNGTFDGQGHSIVGLYARGYNTKLALFVNAKSDSLVKNVKLTNSYLESRGFGGVASFVSGGGGKFEKLYSDAILNVVGAYSGYAGGICSKQSMTVTISECWFDGVIMTTGRTTGGILDEIDSTKATISNCLFSGTIKGTYNHSGAVIGGIAGRTSTKGAYLQVENSLSVGDISTKNEEKTGMVIGEITEGTSFRSVNSYAMAERFPSIGLNGGSMYLLPLQIKESNLKGQLAYQWTDLDFKKIWTIVDKDTPILQCFAEEIISTEGVERAFDISWYKEKSTDNVITTKEQLRGFYILSGRTVFEDTTVKLGADIALNEGNASLWLTMEPEEEWYQIDGFSGTFDGQGHSISGIYINDVGRYHGFFKTTRGSTIKNFSLKNSTIINLSGNDLSTGSIAGVGHGTFENVYSDAIMNLSGFMAGGLLGQVYDVTTVKGCWYDGEITSIGRYTGGIIGAVTGSKVVVENCLNSGTIDITWPPGFANSGGIVGSTFYDKGLSLTIKGCLNTGRIVSKQEGMGSVLGHCVDGTVTISDTYALEGSNTLDGKGVGYVQAKVNGGVVHLPDELLTGYTAYDWSTLDFEKGWSVVLADSPVPKYFASNSPSVAGRSKEFDISWYDAAKDTYEIKTTKELYGLCIVAGATNFKGKTVKLGNDITLNNGNAEEWLTNKPAKIWLPIMDFAGTFDGQGYTISGMYVQKSGRFSGFFGSTTQTAVVKNFALKNSLVKNHGGAMLSTGSVAGVAHGKFSDIYSNAIVDAKGTELGGIFGQIYQDTTVSGCWYDGRIQCNTYGRYAGGVVGVVTGATVNIEHCLNTGELIIKEAPGMVNSGGILGACYYGDDIVVNITDCFNAGSLSAPWDGMGSVLGHCVDGVVNIKNTYATKESNTVDGKAVGWVQGIVNGYVGQLPEKLLLGVNAYRALNLDFDNYWAAVADTTPQLKKFTSNALSLAGVEKLYDTSWYDASKKSFTLTTKEQLYGFSLVATYDDFKDKTVSLGKDIALNNGNATEWLTKEPENLWAPIMDFAGRFDGQGHTISGMYVNKDVRFAGFFGTTTKTAVVKDFSLKNSLVKNHAGVMLSTGSVAGVAHGKFSKIYSNAIVDAKGTDIGGLFGQIYENTTISECWFDGVLQCKEHGRYAGGVVGVVTGGKANIEHCLNTGTVEVHFKGMVNSGGILGSCYYDKKLEVNITDCFNAGKLIAPWDGMGTIVGHCVDGTVNINKSSATKESNTVDGKAVGWVQGIVNGTVLQLPESVLLGTNAYLALNLDFDSYWAAVADKTPQLKRFTDNALSVDGLEKLYDISWYEEGKTTFTLTTKEQLYGFALVSTYENFAGKTVKLGKNISLNSGDAKTWITKAPAYVWSPVMDFAGTFDGQGYTISGMYVNKDSRYAGFFGSTTTSAIVTNFSLKNSLVKNHANAMLSTGSVAGVAHGKFSHIYSNAIVDATGTDLGGLFGQVYEKTTISGCWFDGIVQCKTFGRYAGGVVGVVTGGEVTIEHCHNTGTVDINFSDMVNSGGILGSCYYDKELVVHITDCFGAGKLIAPADGMGSILGHCVDGTVNITKSYATTESNTVDGKAIGWVQGTVNGTVPQFATSALLGIGGYQKMLLDYDNYWIALEEKTPILKKFKTNETVVDLTKYVLVDTTWYTSGEHQGTQTDPFVIEHANDLAGLSTLVNGGQNFSGQYIVLSKDIIYNADAPATLKEWKSFKPKNEFVPIGNPGSGYAFEGTFDGKGYSISGIYVSYGADERWAGLFGYTTESTTIQNLTLKNSYFEAASSQIGSIAARGAGTFKSIHSSAIVNVTDGTASGGAYAGTMVGGLIGMVYQSNIRVTDCHYSGTLIAGTEAGGIIGTTASGNGGGKQTIVEQCSFTGNVTTSGSIAGGIVGYISDSNTYVEKCLSSGYVKGYAQCGGIFGNAYATYVFVTDCHVSGTVESTTNTEYQYVGMFGGIVDTWGNCTLTRCLSTGYMNVVRTDRACANALVGVVKYKIHTSNVYFVKDTDHIPAVNAAYTQMDGGSWTTEPDSYATIYDRAEASLIGENATQTSGAAGLFAAAAEGAWTTREGKVPTLRIFAN